MGRPLVTACMFCLMCATHAHCSSSHDDSNQGPFIEHPNTNHFIIPSDRRKPIEPIYVKSGDSPRYIRSGPSDFVKEVFEEFGDGEVLRREGFEKLLQALTQHSPDEHRHSNSTPSSQNKPCMVVENVIGKSETLTKDSFTNLCPRLVYELVKTNGKTCHDGQSSELAVDANGHRIPLASGSQTAVWVYASLSVVMISLCGLLAVAVIPLMHHGVYHSLLQFLVALAVGTLCGDALLHLLPHAMMSISGHEHDHGQEHGSENGHGTLEYEDNHNTNLWRGLTAACTIIFFYFTEKCLAVAAEWRKRKQRKNAMNTRVRVMRDDGAKTESGSRVGEKLCKHKYSSYPYCYDEISKNPDSHQANNVNPVISEEITREENGAANPMISNHKIDAENENKEDIPNSEKELLEGRESQSDYTTVILREHETRHHGHAHTHGHVHSAPRSLGSVAWMVVLGDGLHNFTDGLAIGAAFASNIGGGVSTAVAVFCHELPHELGDFAVLLKAGMSAKQAVFYNLLSSVLCMFGMCLGVMLGHRPDTTLWVFSAAAGMFLYIALVDMIPELTSSHPMEGGSEIQGLLQLAGLVTGVSTMLIIALYEHDLKSAFKDSF